MLGKTEVSESRGSHVVRDAIHAIDFQLKVSFFKITFIQKSLASKRFDRTFWLKIKKSRYTN